MKCLFKNFKTRKASTLLLSIMLIIFSKVNFAGAPFLTDDPVPLNSKQWEIFLFTIFDKNNDLFLEPDLFAPAIEINYGPLDDLQLHAIVPYAWSLPNAAPPANGLGDIEVGVKYRFIRETSKQPQVGFAPLLELPSGNVYQNLGNGIPWVKLPVWAQKSWGKWTTYGGTGYAINTAPGMLNYFYTGWLLQRKLKESLTLGSEIFYQGAITADGNASVILNVGGFYNFNKNFSLLFTAGHSIAGQNHLVGYLGLYWTFGKVYSPPTSHRRGGRIFFAEH
ncbi:MULTISPECIES: transporter [Legionella]|uniref:Transporter n=1 Tax=Legionella steelei TaxID=947033 RepID=A0A0W0ZI78_9GAMM|nr:MULTISPECIES: transporter [Legionella]KTD68696.1 hypothetical protein Lste_1854 [Legionella steelei]MBN9226727.1 transporter [Legionella steelei]OJW06720.1 MAG: hypothetical protein BGO44_18190 [Legionella sp. 39-23]